MGYTPSRICGASLCGIVLLSLVARIDASHGSPQEPLTGDPVVARVHEHLSQGPKPLILAVGSDRFTPPVWKRVNNLVAFRIHRHRAEGTTVADAAIYLNRDSKIYMNAAATLRNGATQQEYLWCLLAAIVAHESAHTAPMTEHQALMAEVAQLRRCLLEGHLFTGNEWNPVTYLGQVEAKLRHPREHY